MPAGTGRTGTSAAEAWVETTIKHMDHLETHLTDDAVALTSAMLAVACAIIEVGKKLKTR